MDEEHARILTVCLLIIFGIICVSEVLARSGL